MFIIRFLLLIFILGLISCDKCQDKTKHFYAELFPTVRKTYYDWEKVEYLTGDTIYFGVGTEYFVCNAKGEEELKSTPIEFYSDRYIVINSDTIPSKTNLFLDGRIMNHIFFYKKTDAFFNSPQYLIRIDNKVLRLKDYYTFYFKGFTKSGVEINDSTIVYIK